LCLLGAFVGMVGPAAGRTRVPRSVCPVAARPRAPRVPRPPVVRRPAASVPFVLAPPVVRKRKCTNSCVPFLDDIAFVLI
jgi:hypothetical protein